MAILRSQVILPYKSGQPEDIVVNTWHFAISGPLTGAAEDAQVNAALTTFYQAIDGFLASTLDATSNAASVQTYLLDPGGAGPEDDDAGSPVNVDTFTITPGGGTPLPHEVAMCLSMSSDLTGVAEEDGSTRPASRRRGRIYLGPLDTSVVGVEGVTNNARPGTGARNAILDAAETMVNALQAFTNPINLSVYSRVEGVTRPVTKLWMDDAFDTMRGRGADPTSRLSRNV